MTDKRFIVKYVQFDGYSVYDKIEKVYYDYDKDDLEKLCNFLNELYEENIKLKKGDNFRMNNGRFMVDDCGTLIDLQTRNTYDYVDEIVDFLNEIVRENDALKKFVKDNFSDMMAEKMEKNIGL